MARSISQGIVAVFLACEASGFSVHVLGSPQHGQAELHALPRQANPKPDQVPETSSFAGYSVSILLIMLCITLSMYKLAKSKLLVHCMKWIVIHLNNIVLNMQQTPLCIFIDIQESVV